MAAGQAPAKGWRRKIWPALLALPVFAGVILMAGLFVPIPILDIVAAVCSQIVWLAPLALLLTVLAVLLWRAHRTRFRAALAALAGALFVGGIIVTGQSFALAAANNVNINVGELLFGFSLENAAPDETLEYTQYDGAPVTLSVWRPADASGAAPVLVMTHGGGFTGGAVEEQLLPYARWFANHGYLVIGANYTLSSERVHAWDVAEGQIACALAWARANAAAYGGDISRLGMYGESAGGNLAINVSYKAASGALASSCGGALPQVSAVSAIYPVVGIIESYNNPHMLGATGRQFDEQYLGGSPEQYPERYASAQSLNAISAAAPPTLIVYGGADHLVPPNGTRNFAAAATAAGLAIRAIEIPYGEHGFDLISGGAGAQIWRRGSLDWFAEHLSPPRASTASNKS